MNNFDPTEILSSLANVQPIPEESWMGLYNLLKNNPNYRIVISTIKNSNYIKNQENKGE